LAKTGYHRRHFAVFGLAGKFETDPIGIIKIDVEQSGKLRDGSNAVDAVRFQPLFNLAEALGRHDKGTMLHGANGVAIAGWFLPFRNLEEREQAVIPHIEEVVAHLRIGWVAAIGGASPETGRRLHGVDERHAEHIDIKSIVASTSSVQSVR
jgi:hypothetical protein